MTTTELYDGINEKGAEVLLRFGGNEGLLIKFLKKFAADQTFAALTSALKDERGEEVFRAAHTLKGLYANFGFEKAKDLASVITEAYRNGKHEDISGPFLELDKIHKEIVGRINEFLS